ncbi:MULTISPECIES: 3-hydroxyacyl-ACP dehydratase FabZ family protein [Amycolatopsis]|uniref:3-hydroxyacyl-ACP dehydratase FabZ family protein n=1 Tax=Amycolatopsis albidoflavus TaxID=102226 RepID=A0ABW5I713_9PSEU
MTGALGTAGIVRLIPHRYPILLLDRVLTVVPGKELTGLKAVTCAEPCFRDAVEDYRYPPSLLLESWAQAAVVLATWGQPNPDVLVGKLELAAVLNGARFHRPAVPGDVIEHHVVLQKQLGETSVVAGHSLIDGELALEIEQFVLAMRELGDVLAGAQPATAT